MNDMESKKPKERMKLYSAKSFADELRPIMEEVKSLMERTGYLQDKLPNLVPENMELDKNSPESVFQYEEAGIILTHLYNAWLETELIKPVPHCGTIRLDKRTANYVIELDDGSTKDVVLNMPIEILVPIDTSVTPPQFKWVRTSISVDVSKCNDCKMYRYFPKAYPNAELDGMRVRYRWESVLQTGDF
jgi:hypothetical protein